MYRLSCLLLALSMLLAGCDSSGSNPDDEPDEPQLVETQLLPLTIGNEWTYSTSDEETETLVLEKDTTINGTKYTLGTETDSRFDFEDPEIYRYDDTGLRKVFRDGDLQFYFLYPDDDEGTLTDSSYVISKSQSVVWRGRLEEENMTVETPAGTFENVLKYRVTQEDADTGELTALREFWFEPDVGIVKRHFETDFGGSTDFLKSYELQ
ncbi:hypothetical protein [Salinibacter altiplanensis]|uniref:hypothetical protein n=1 Tax=Salinibacter altiplanensis TaxID=1803181 RepID=UPI000C9EDC00|nr:hypothetical protein [Salinibacter altiplanensis]